MGPEYPTEKLRDEEGHGRHGHQTYTEKSNDSPTDPGFPKLDQEMTLEPIDVENKHAFKGDESDGHVSWGLRQILAAIFLSGLYTGM